MSYVQIMMNLAGTLAKRSRLLVNVTADGFTLRSAAV